MKTLKKKNIIEVNSEYIKTAKNKQVEFFYEQRGFKLVGELEEEKEKKFMIDIESYKDNNSEYIKLEEREGM